MPNFGQLAGKVKSLVSKHPDTVSKGVDKAEEMTDKKTGGQYNDQVHQAGQWVEGQLGADEAQPGQQDRPPSS
ncbi:MAG: antitoxin [Trebonia sp.]